MVAQDAQLLRIIMVAISTAAAVLFGVWRIQAHYETRNDNAHDELRGLIKQSETNNEAAHGELRGLIKQSETNNEAAHGELRGELRDMAANVNILVGRQQERDRQQGAD